MSAIDELPKGNTTAVNADLVLTAGILVPIMEGEQATSDNFPESDNSTPNGSQEFGKDLSPPRSTSERFRDWILRTLDSQLFQIIGYIVLFLVILDGALFFFFLVGWQTLCRPRTDCEPRNEIYNLSVQILNGLFTYMAIVSMPWRCTNAIHVFGCGLPRRDNGKGKNLYGMSSDDVWFHIPLIHRQSITSILLWNCIFQFANQATRIIYWNYGLQNGYPGNLWTNIFFGASMICAAIGALYLAIIENKVRKQNPELFEPGPIQMFTAWWKHRRRRQQPQATDDAADSVSTTSYRREVLDPTQNLQGPVLGTSAKTVRGGLRMFGL